jgi:hypothetical protein
LRLDGRRHPPDRPRAPPRRTVVDVVVFPISHRAPGRQPLAGSRSKRVSFSAKPEGCLSGINRPRRWPTGKNFLGEVLHLHSDHMARATRTLGPHVGGSGAALPRPPASGSTATTIVLSTAPAAPVCCDSSMATGWVELHRNWPIIELAENGSRRSFDRRHLHGGNVWLPWIRASATPPTSGRLRMPIIVNDRGGLRLSSASVYSLACSFFGFFAYFISPIVLSGVRSSPVPSAKVSAPSSCGA